MLSIMLLCRMIIFCGEVVTTGLLERCIKLLPHIQYVNLYSVSEAHDIACFDLSAWYRQEQVHHAPLSGPAT